MLIRGRKIFLLGNNLIPRTFLYSIGKFLQWRTLLLRIYNSNFYTRACEPRGMKIIREQWLCPSFAVMRIIKHFCQVVHRGRRQKEVKQTPAGSSLSREVRIGSHLGRTTVTGVSSLSRLNDLIIRNSLNGSLCQNFKGMQLLFVVLRCLTLAENPSERTSSFFNARV